MSAAYDTWSKARLQEELRSRSLPDKGSTKSLRERLRDSDRDGNEASGANGSGGERAQRDRPQEQDVGEERGHADGGRRREPGEDGGRGEREVAGEDGGREREDGGQEREDGGREREAAGEDGGRERDGVEDGRRRATTPEREGRDSGGGEDGDSALLPPREILRRAVRQVTAITGREVMEVIGARRANAGWRVTVEILESERVPSSGDLLAAYEVALDQRGRVRSIDRKRRYTREPAARRPHTR